MLRVLETCLPQPVPCQMLVENDILFDDIYRTYATLCALIVSILLSYDGATAWLRRLGDTGGWRATV